MLSSNRINWLGLLTLYHKEVLRFFKVYHQTLIAPTVNALVFLAIFMLAMQDKVHAIEGVPFKIFMGAGLVIMSVVQNAFANTSSVLTYGKVVGTNIDYIMPPLKPYELNLAITMGGVTRGLAVGVLVFIAMYFFVGLTIIHPFYALAYLLLSAIMLSQLGILTGLIADSFDEMSAITSYIITPLSFLSGTFYSVKSLPTWLYQLSHLNPFFYMIDGFRYGLTDYHDGSLIIGASTLIICNIVLWIIIEKVLETGWRLKS